MADPEKIVPENRDGLQTNTESAIELETEKEAEQFFRVIRERLFNINHWKEYAGTATAGFQLTDENGKPVNRKPKPGDHFKIDIPGPSTITGEGSDWARIETIEDEQNCAGIRVRPATNPTNHLKGVAHFFNEQSTSSFIVKKEGKKITAGVYGRNEKPNTDVEKTADKIRNAIVAGGAISGLSKVQWKNLVNGLVKKNP